MGQCRGHNEKIKNILQISCYLTSLIIVNESMDALDRALEYAKNESNDEKSPGVWSW
jgi:hypothetical protein